MAWGLLGMSLAFFGGFLLSFLAAPAIAGHGRLFDKLMLLSFMSGVVLVIWMLVACIRDKGLTAQERLRWELLLLVGGPITAAAYLLSRPRPTGSGDRSESTKS